MYKEINVNKININNTSMNQMLYTNINLISISFRGIDPYRDTPKMHMIAQDNEGFANTCTGVGPNLNGMSNIEVYIFPIT